jgi:hypothetical protein
MNMKVESSVPVDDSVTVSMDGGEKQTQVQDQTAYSFADGQTSRVDGSEVPEAAVEETPEVTEEEVVDTSEVELQDLGEFSEDRAAEFDSYYKGEDGQFDKAILTAEFDANKDKGTAGLNESTYDYLATQGFNRELVKEIEASLEAQRSAAPTVDERSAKLVGAAGGDTDALTSALKWAKDSGTYDEAARKRFNQVTSGKDEMAAVEAVELLMARYSKAKASELPKVPQRDATNGTAAPGSKKAAGYKSRAEAREGRKSSMNDPKKWAQHNARLAASDRSGWYD